MGKDVINPNSNKAYPIDLKREDQLIMENWDKLNEQLRYKISNSWLSNMGSIENLILESLSHLGDNINKFDSSKASFITWASNLCYKRLIDEYRIRHRGQNIIGIINKCKNEIVREGRKVSRESLKEKLKENLGDEKGAELAIQKYNKMNTINEGSITSSLKNKKENNFFDIVEDKKLHYDSLEWNDFNSHLNHKLQVLLLSGDIDIIQYHALVENIIPKVMDKDYRTLRDLASEFNLSESYISQKTNNQKFKNTMKKLFIELDLIPH